MTSHTFVKQLSGRSARASLGAIELGAAAQAQRPAAAAGEQAEIAALKAEIELLKGMLPSQSHTMIDVEYHFANLWFAARNAQLAARDVLSQRDARPLELGRARARRSQARRRARARPAGRF